MKYNCFAVRKFAIFKFNRGYTEEYKFDEINKCAIGNSNCNLFVIGEHSRPIHYFSWNNNMGYFLAFITFRRSVAQRIAFVVSSDVLVHESLSFSLWPIFSFCFSISTSVTVYKNKNVKMSLVMIENKMQTLKRLL